MLRLPDEASTVSGVTAQGQQLVLYPTVLRQPSWHDQAFTLNTITHSTQSVGKITGTPASCSGSAARKDQAGSLRAPAMRCSRGMLEMQSADTVS